MNTVIADRARSVRAEKPQGRGLYIVPILGSSHDLPDYRVLDLQTLPQVRVTEIGEHGQVPTLRVENTLETRLFLMDGQELVGAKQNRILNTDVMVPASSTLDIPVSCVEAHRWSYNSPHFSPGKTASRRVRSGKLGRVDTCLRKHAGYDGGQGEVWDEVRSSLSAAGVSSNTEALSDAYEKRKVDLDSFRAELRLPEQAVGVAVFEGNRWLGLDMFDRHSTLRYFWDSLVDSYAIEWLGSAIDMVKPPESPQAEAVQRSLDVAAAADWAEFKPPGEGTDWRLATGGMNGSALVMENVVVHLQLFPQAEADAQRPRIRRRYMVE